MTGSVDFRVPSEGVFSLSAPIFCPSTPTGAGVGTFLAGLLFKNPVASLVEFAGVAAGLAVTVSDAAEAVAAAAAAALAALVAVAAAFAAAAAANDLAVRRGG